MKQLVTVIPEKIMKPLKIACLVFLCSMQVCISQGIE
jgi:hypothetical protein